MAAYKLVVFSNPVAGREDEYNSWYTGAHLRDVLKIPGFTSAQRLAVNAPDGAAAPAYRYLATYEIETDDPQAVLDELGRRAGTDAMPLSEALDMKVDVSLYRVIAERAAEPAPDRVAAEA